MRIKRLAARLQREDGMALMLTMVLMTVMAIMMSSMLAYTSASARDSYLRQSEQSAHSLAEGALNQGAAQLASHYYDSANKTNNTAASFSLAWFVGSTASQQSSTSTGACFAQSTCMSWDVESCSFYTPVSGCTVTLGTPGATKGTVVLRGTGSVPNPTGGSARTATVTAKVDVSQPPALVDTPTYWKGIYSGAPPSGTCDTSLGQGVTITAPLYVAGNLCLTGSAQIYGSTNTLKVLGWAWLRNTSRIGVTSGAPGKISLAQIKKGCSITVTQPTGLTVCTINQTGGKIWDTTPASAHASTIPTADPLPTVDWAGAQASQNNSTPAPTCTGGRFLTELTFQLNPNASYSCTSGVGSIIYTYVAGGTSTLQVNGTVYFTGNVNIQAKVVRYSGISSFFIGGSVTGANNAYLCVKVLSGNCDFANAKVVGNAGFWDTSQNVLLLQSMGAMTGTNLRFQGGVYSATSISLTGGQGSTQGPLVTPGILNVAQQLDGSFPDFPLIWAGSLGTSPPYVLGKPYGGSY